MKMNKIALSIIIAILAAPVFASEFKSYQLSDYNCEEGSLIEVKACLETTLAEKNANLSEAEYHLKKAITDIQVNDENAKDFKSIIADEKSTFKMYSEQQCELKVAIERVQNNTIDVERLSLICQINAIDHRVESLTEMTNDLVNAFVNKNSEIVKSTDTVELKDDAKNNDVSSPPDVNELPTEEIKPIETTDSVPPESNEENDL